MINKKQIIYKIRSYIQKNKREQLFNLIEGLIIETQLINEIACHLSGPELGLYESDRFSNHYINKISIHFLNLLINYKSPKNAYIQAYKNKLISDCEIDDIIKNKKQNKQ